MGRSKRKNKLQLKKPYESNSLNLSQTIKINNDLYIGDEIDSENSESLINNPALLNHINDIQNVNENVLIWNDADVIDQKRNQNLSDIIDNEIIKESMKNSPFSYYLEAQLKEIGKINPSALSGVIMNNYQMKFKNGLNEISNNSYSDLDTKKTPFEDLNIIDQDILVSNIENSEEMSPKRESDLSSPTQQLRRSGRSKKINYLDMINIQIFDHKKSFDHDSISPNRKFKCRTSVTKTSLKSSLSESCENDSKSQQRRQYVENKNNENKLEDMSKLEGESKENIIIKTDECSKIPIKEIDEKVNPDILSDINDISTNNIGDAIQTTHDTLVDRDFDKDDITNDYGVPLHPVIEVKTEENMEDNNIKTKGDDEIDSPKRSKEQRIKTRSKYSSKQKGVACILCPRDVFSTKSFVNVCYKCSCTGKKIMERLRIKANLACVGEPPCWIQMNGDDLCDACTIQKYIQHGLKWGPAFNDFHCLTLDELRVPEFVEKTRLAHQEECEQLLNSMNDLPSNKTCSSCILTADKDESTPCKWDITIFMPNMSDDAICELCNLVSTSDNNILYHVLPNRDHIVCHKCLLSAWGAYNEMDNTQTEPCKLICKPVAKCSKCLLACLQTICPLNSIKHRYFDGINNPLKLCVICLRQDDSIITVLRSGNIICLVCMCHIKIHFFKKLGHCSSGSCLIVSCSDCLIELACKVINITEVVTHVHSISDKLDRKPVKRQRQSEDCEDINVKRPCVKKSLEIDANWVVPESGDNGRSKRKIKKIQYDDYIVDHRCLPHPTNDKSDSKSKVIKVSEMNWKKYDDESVDYDTLTSGKDYWKVKNDDNDIDKNDHLVANDINEVNETKPDVKISKIDLNMIDDKGKSEINILNEGSIKSDMIDSVNALDVNLDNELAEKDESPLDDESTSEVKDKEKEVSEDTPKSCRRIKQAIPSFPSVTVEEASTPLVGRTSGPRVKQVSRQNVNVDLNLDLVRQKCVVKRTNRVTKKPDKLNNFIMDQPEILESHIDEIQSNDPATSNDAHLHPENKCGNCVGCKRNRSCGKCDPCLLNKSQKRRTEICVKMICDNINEQDQLDLYSYSPDKIGNIRHSDASLQNESTDNADKSVDEILPTKINIRGNEHVAEVYRDSDSDDLSSEEEQLDPELDNIHIVKGDMITTGLTHEGGFPVITSFKAQPNKVLCFSCGSGGDQMIHCVSCAEPFHFFCIEFQFRPKSKEMFVCRNCTKCDTCEGYGSDLKCIKCQLGFHPSCVDKYPPSRSEDKSDWACYKCAMCLHCGAKAEDAMEHADKNTCMIDWSKDPWQCGRCARARKDGHVCPECGRAYQTGLETLECRTCSGMVHRQCSGLTEDEYEMLKLEPAPTDISDTFTCSKCNNNSTDDESKKRVRLKRQCKESGLKMYCERGVTRRMSEYIHKGETHEELLLEQYHISETGPYNRNSMSLSQVDGADDESDNMSVHGNGIIKDYDTVATSSPLVENGDRGEMNHTSSTICNSSESIGEYDMEQLSTLDMEQSNKVDLDCDLEVTSIPRTKIGIFSRLNASDFLSPKHLLMEALAKINIKLSRYPSRSQIHNLYNTLLLYLHDLSEQIFPWIDFSGCVEWVQTVIKKNSGRMKLVLQTIYDYVKESTTREFDVFSSSIWEIEEKLNNSFQRGREEFIIFHSEQHLTTLMKNLESRTPDNIQYTNYRLAFETEDKSNTICEKDVRNCALCGYSGDDGLEGRLIYGGLDVWVHVNCALWSDEVYEKEDGALVNVDAAIRRGETTICSSCNNFGATIRCSAEDSLDGYGDGCSNIYHFGCAFNLLTDPVFTESRTFCCSEMHEIHSKDEQQLGLADMLILRRIYLPQGCLGSVSVACSNGLPSEQIVVSIGNLRIDSLGKIESCSDSHKVFLCPIGYKARRLFWSMHELDSLVMYYMTIKKELNKNINDESSQSVSHVVVQEAPVVRRRRMIETADSRCVKRSKLMECKQEIVYEMDDDGNLRPISTSSTKSITKELFKFQEPYIVMENKKINRRFPINTKSQIELIQATKEEHKVVTKHHTNQISSRSSEKEFIQSSSACQSPGISSELHPVSSLSSYNPVQTAPQNQIYHQLGPHQSISQTINYKPISLSQPMRLVNSVTPKVLRINKITHVQSRLPQTLIRPFQMDHNISKPLSIMSVSRPINSANNLIHTTPSVSNKPPRRIFKIMKVSTINPTYNAQSSTRINTTQSNNTNPSVLRTVLTDNTQHLPNRPSINRESPYFISSSGSLSNLPVPQLSQYDGGADDCSVISDSHFSAGSVCSDQENISVSTKRRYTTKPRSHLDYKYCLRFVIQGFKGSKSPKSSWTYLVRRIMQMRKGQGLTEYALKTGDGWTKFGIDHRHVVYLTEQMVSAFQCRNYEFKFHKNRVNKLREQCSRDVPSLHGCARFSPWCKVKPNHIAIDPLAFLHCKANHPPKNHAPDNLDEEEVNPDPNDDYLQKLALQFRSLQNGTHAREKNVRVCCSVIHGRGLFARRSFDAHEVIIEYVGEVIRSILSDVRETEYQKTGLDCYMFRLDQEYIVDATFKGNAARFINHSCRPNCYAKVVRFEGEKHIIIIAQRKIFKGEELTYNYRFPIEDDKLPCTCGSFSCKKYLN